jgi:hypothetical protein
MKKLIPILLFCFSLNAFAQEDTPPQDTDKKHEVTINALTLIASEWVDFSYEYLINEESSFGVDVQFGLDNDKNNVFRKFSVTPNYRRYFSENYARGFFVEAFGMIHSSEDFITVNNGGSFSEQLKTRTDFSLGISVGGKWVTKSGFVTEIFGGLGRNLLNSEDDFTQVAGRIGISLGYRF